MEAGVATFVPFSKDEIHQSIPERFEQQVRRFPDRLAVDDQERAWSYADLNRQANRIGHAIFTMLGPGGEPVILLLEQGAVLVAAILGVLKAGAFYVPLNPAFPIPRLADIVAETGTSLIVASRSTLSLASSVLPRAARVLDVDAIPADTSDQDLSLRIPPDAGAYIYFTSGSTGRPKGVFDTHRNVLHNIMRYTNSLHIGSEDRMTLLQGPSFSGAVSSLFGALLNGASTFPFDVPRQGPSRVAPWLVTKAITIYHSVPSLFREVATSSLQFPQLRLIRLEGDRVSMRDIELYRARFEPSCVLVNGLGATECGLARQFFVSRDTVLSDGVVPIGFPVEDMHVVLDREDGSEAHPGDTGEIVVSSRYLAQGYWRRPDLTAVSFREDPHVPGLRMYHTGDLGRFRPDGCLEHLGRKDGSVKLRGQTVALADVEGALQRGLGVREAVVLAVPTNSGDARLVAYVVPSGRPVPTVSSLRRGLSERLPVFMIPTAFVFLDTLPLSENLKVDRRALPPPGQERPDLDVPRVPARNLLELQLVQIWESVLGIGTIGVRDDFYDLGGDSLSAVAMLTEVEQALGCSLLPSVLLEQPTVEHLAENVGRGVSELSAPVIAVRSNGERPPFFFLHGDYLSGGFYCANLARYLGPDQPFYLLPPCGLDGGHVPGSYSEMSVRHLEAMRSVQPTGPYRIGGLCNGGLVAYEIARRLEAQGERVECLVLVASVASTFELEWLRHFLQKAGRWQALDEGRQLDRIARMRDMMSTWRALPLQGRLEHAMLFLRKAVAHLVSGRRSGGESPGPPSASLRSVYRRIDVAYTPGAYGGQVSLLWPSEDPVSIGQAARWWQRVARRVEAHAVPGTHLTCVTLHARATATLLSSLLQGMGPAGRQVIARGLSQPGSGGL
jgi:amino acid adenylation domain-containing protein